MIMKIKAKIKKRCNLCGNNFDMWDIQENFCFHHRVGYGSKYDGVIWISICAVIALTV